MPTLTDADTNYIRAKSGDLVCDGKSVVDGGTLQAYFDLANGDRPTTIVSVLEDMWAKAKAEAGIVTDFGTAVDNANVDNIKDRLDYWRAEAFGSAKPLGRVSAGVFDLGLDAVEEDTA